MTRLLARTPDARMRARLVRPGLVLAAAGTCVLALGASAAPPGSLVTKDTAGDANLLNSQFISDPSANQGIATPGSQPGLDILKVELKNTFSASSKGRQSTAAGCTGFAMRMTLSGPPADGSHFQMSATTKNNSRFLVIEHNSAIDVTAIRYGGNVEQDLSYGDGPSVNRERRLKAAVIDGNTITWTATRADISEVGEKPGSVVELTEAETLLGDNRGIDPVVDHAPAAEKTFTICR